MAYIYLAADESVLVEPDGMATMSAGVRVDPGVGPGGIVKAAMRKSLGSESFFMGRYTAEVDGAWVGVAPKYPGDMSAEDLVDESILIEAGALVAVGGDLAIDVKWAGLKSIALREGATMLRVSGSGMLLVGSYGGIQRFTLAEGESLVVDTGHLVGFTDSMGFKVGPLSSATTSVLVGEGLVGVLTGPGTVLVQTRAEQSLKDWLFPEKSQNKS